jgi:hypothetical protein
VGALEVPVGGGFITTRGVWADAADEEEGGVMGDFRLGCLLGQADRAQSFDVASAAWSPIRCGSWAFGTSQSSAFPQDTDVHSSGQGVRVHVFSSANVGSPVLAYDYEYANDAQARWFPEVATHGIATRWRARCTAAYSGQVYVTVNPGFYGGTLIGGAAELEPYFQETSVISAQNERFLLYRGVTTVGSFAVWLDDVLTEVDPIVVHAEWPMESGLQVMRQSHRGASGRVFTVDWGSFFRYRVPLRYVPAAHAEVINWWWMNGFHVLATLDTSDSEAVRVVKIRNSSQPFIKRERPYEDLWAGVLELESIDQGSLVF